MMNNEPQLYLSFFFLGFMLGIAALAIVLLLSLKPQKRKLIWEINWDLADKLLGANYVAGRHGNWYLPNDLIDAICRHYPTLAIKHGDPNWQERD